MVPLFAALLVQQMVHPVFLSGEVYKPPPQDSAISSHNRTNSVIVDAQIHSKGKPPVQRLVAQG